MKRKLQLKPFLCHLCKSEDTNEEEYLLTNIVFKILTRAVAMCLSIGNCQCITEDMNEDTISVLVRLITEKKGMWPAKVTA